MKNKFSDSPKIIRVWSYECGIKKDEAYVTRGNHLKNGDVVKKNDLIRS